MEEVLEDLDSSSLPDAEKVLLPFPDRVLPINPSPRTGPTGVEFVSFAAGWREFALLTEDDSDPRREENRLYRVSLTSGSARLVKAYPDTKGGVIPMGLAWSPDGTSLAVMEAGEKSASLLLYLESGEARRLQQTGQRHQRQEQQIARSDGGEDVGDQAVGQAPGGRLGQAPLPSGGAFAPTFGRMNSIRDSS